MCRGMGVHVLRVFWCSRISSIYLMDRSGTRKNKVGRRSLISPGTKVGLYSPHIRAGGLMYSRTLTITYCFDHLRVCGDHGPHSSLPGLGLGSRALGKRELLHRFNMTSSPASHSPCILPGYAQLYSLYDE